ncbi:hypothetical protein [Plantactinospora sp. KBS50]|uniref:hypothetical protein n=1 Tax=Plantactinospora sp. KBS50 TaxID=2024580 RepID=UPI0012FD1A5F|nr:hypothetical protein [Plantactinospora sp. KBS50]
MDRPVASVLLVVGVVLGVVAGRSWATARRAWGDYSATKASVPKFRKTAWTLVRAAFTKGGVVALICLAAMGYAAVGR